MAGVLEEWAEASKGEIVVRLTEALMQASAARVKRSAELEAALDALASSCPPSEAVAPPLKRRATEPTLTRPLDSRPAEAAPPAALPPPALAASDAQRTTRDSHGALDAQEPRSTLATQEESVSWRWHIDSATLKVLEQAFRHNPFPRAAERQQLRLSNHRTSRSTCQPYSSFGRSYGALRPRGTACFPIPNPHAHPYVAAQVGDPFKDTSGPALNILIKLMSMVSLTVAPLLKDWGRPAA